MCGLIPTAGSNPALSASKQANKRLSGRFFVFIYHCFYHPIYGWIRCAGMSNVVPARKMGAQHFQDQGPSWQSSALKFSAASAPRERTTRSLGNAIRRNQLCVSRPWFQSLVCSGVQVVLSPFSSDAPDAMRSRSCTVALPRAVPCSSGSTSPTLDCSVSLPAQMACPTP